MKIAALICRILLGLVFVVFGLNKLYVFMPATMPPGDAGTWSLLMVHHHWLAIVGIFETVGGLLLLSGRFVPLGLTLLAPIIVNILLFGFLFTPLALGSGIAVALLELFLIYAYRSYFAPLFTAKPQVS
jgi:putative oxidoreductase